MNVAAKHGDGGFRQNESTFTAFGHDGCQPRPVGVGVTVFPVIFPDVLLAAEGHQGDGPGKGCVRLLFESSKTTRTVCELFSSRFTSITDQLPSGRCTA